MPLQLVLSNMAQPTRRSFVHKGAEIYQWEQTLEDVVVYITAPPNVRAAAIECKLSSGHVRLGLRGNPPFLNVRLPIGCGRWKYGNKTRDHNVNARGIFTQGAHYLRRRKN